LVGAVGGNGLPVVDTVEGLDLGHDRLQVTLGRSRQKGTEEQSHEGPQPVTGMRGKVGHFEPNLERS
jgi:hypothetical protein